MPHPHGLLWIIQPLPLQYKRFTLCIALSVASSNTISMHDFSYYGDTVRLECEDHQAYHYVILCYSPVHGKASEHQSCKT